jgi:hypothetical protein
MDIPKRPAPYEGNEAGHNLPFVIRDGHGVRYGLGRKNQVRPQYPGGRNLDSSEYCLGCLAWLRRVEKD